MLQTRVSIHGYPLKTLIHWRTVLVVLWLNLTASLGQSTENLPLSSHHPSRSSFDLPVDISPAYVQWSKWQHDRVMTELRARANIKVEPISYIEKRQYEVAAVHPANQTTHVFIQKTTRVTKSYEPFQQTTSIGNLNNDTIELTLSDTNKNATFVVYPKGLSIVLSILTAVISFITIFGNILVLLSSSLERTLRTATNYFIASLAVTDLLIGIFSMNFYTLYLMLGRWPLGRLSCDLWLSLDHTACLTSQYTVLFITIDRFLSVRIPAKYRNWRTDKKVGIMVAATWIIPSSVFFTIIMGWPYFDSGMQLRPNEMCYAEFSYNPIFNTIFTVCYFWVTFVVLIGLYAAIYKVAENLQKRSDEKRQQVSGLIRDQENANDTGRVVKPPRGKMLKSSLNQAGLQHSPQPHSSSSMVGVNESSGFDSDEENKRREEKVNKNTSIKDAKTNFSAISPAAAALAYQSYNEEIQPTPLVNILNLHPKKDNLTKKPEELVKIQTVGKKITNRQECPVHRTATPVDGAPTNSTEQTSAGNYSPSSVRMFQPEGIQISSPVLTDDDSGFEINGSEELANKNVYLPPSPAMCICSDLEEDPVNVDQFNYQQSSTKVYYEHAVSDKEVFKYKRSSIKGSPNSNGIINPTSMKPVIKVPPVKPTNDPEYQNRVMEAFHRRMAANQLTVPSGILEVPKPTTIRTTSGSKNRYLQTAPKTQYSNNHPNASSSDDQSGTDIQSIFIGSGERYGHDISICDSRDTQQGEEDISPIWKQQSFTEMDTFSTACSTKGINSFEHPEMTGCCEPNQECLICAGHSASDSDRSTSTYDEYDDRSLVERRCCYFTMSLENEAQRRRKRGDSTKHHPLLPLSIDKSFCKKCANCNWLFEFKKKFARSDKQIKKAPIERGRRENRARKALRTITIILGAYLLCWTPYHVVIMIKGICDDVSVEYTCVDDILYSITYWLCYINSPINPFCYALANAQYKKTFLRLFRGDFRRT